MDWKKPPRFYLNPITGRLIKSTGRVYKRLKQDSILISRDKCMYNNKSAQHCLINNTLSKCLSTFKFYKNS